MTRKKRQENLRESLSSAVRPPEKNPKLDEILGRYANAQPMLGQPQAAPQEPQTQPPLGITTDPSDGQSPSDGQTTPLSITPPPKPIAPDRDFNKRANSLERIALPSGMFPGASKKIYDALYVRTRGAVKPSRTLRATKKDVAQWSGVSNRKTIDMHLRYLETAGLIVRKWELGNTEGYLFEVRLPEETSLMDRGAEGDRPPEGTDQKRDRGTDQKLVSDGQSQTLTEKATSGELKTSFKTNTERTDDEASRRLASALSETERELTGKNTTNPEPWGELAEVLITELRIAAGRTTVSSVPAFLAEHLRRRLWKKDKRQLDKEGQSDSGPSQPAAKVDSSKCPDCFGTGMWYPEGFEKGVARCRHEKLGAVE
jgi:hypothetical protein